MWRAAVCLIAALFLTGATVAYNDHVATPDEQAYIRDIMPYAVLGIRKTERFMETEYEIQMFRGAEPVGVVVKLFAPFDWETFRCALRDAAAAVVNSGKPNE
jgi:hypothetical protein